MTLSCLISDACVISTTCQGAHNGWSQGKGHSAAQNGHLLAVLQRAGKTFCQRMVAPVPRPLTQN